MITLVIDRSFEMTIHRMAFDGYSSKTICMAWLIALNLSGCRLVETRVAAYSSKASPANWSKFNSAINCAFRAKCSKNDGVLQMEFQSGHWWHDFIGSLQILRHQKFGTALFLSLSMRQRKIRFSRILLLFLITSWVTPALPGMS